MRLSTTSIALAALFLLSSFVAAQSDFPDLSTVVEGGASTTSKPAQKTGSSKTSGGSNDFPVVTGPAGAVPTYPAPSIPPTVDAPFMQKSTLPQGTVFICVGAALGFLLACVLAWRGFLMWTVRRNIKRANAGYVGLPAQGAGSGALGGANRKSAMMGTGLLDGSVALLKKKSPFYDSKSSAAAGSSMTLTPLNPTESKSRSPSGNALSASLSAMAPSKSSLFFSPTAGAAGSAGLGAGGGIPVSNLGVKRGEGYLPSGYYAGSNQAGSGLQERASRQFSMADFEARQQQAAEYGAQPMRGRGTRQSSRPDLLDARRESQGRLISYDSRRDSSYGATPRLGAIANQSAISLGSGTGEGGRAPSAYLEDLFSTPPVPQHEQH